MQAYAIKTSIFLTLQLKLAISNFFHPNIPIFAAQKQLDFSYQFTSRIFISFRRIIAARFFLAFAV